MGLIAKEPDETTRDFEPTPEGLHEAVCYGVFDLGTHFNERFAKSIHQIVILWELTDVLIKIDNQGVTEEKPRAISKKYTLSLHEKSNLRKDLQTWRGKSFTEKELEGFDLENLLGKPAQIQVIHNNSGDKVYANISSILPSKVKEVKMSNNVISFSFADQTEIPSDTPEWIREIIKTSDEWIERTGNNQDNSDPSDGIPF